MSSPEVTRKGSHSAGDVHREEKTEGEEKVDDVKGGLGKEGEMKEVTSPGLKGRKVRTFDTKRDKFNLLKGKLKDGSVSIELEYADGRELTRDDKIAEAYANAGFPSTGKFKFEGNDISKDEVSALRKLMRYVGKDFKIDNKGFTDDVQQARFELIKSILSPLLKTLIEEAEADTSLTKKELQALALALATDNEFEWPEDLSETDREEVERLADEEYVGLEGSVKHAPLVFPKVKVDFETLKAELKAGTRQVVLDDAIAQAYINNGFEHPNFDDLEKEQKNFLELVRVFVLGGYTRRVDTWKLISEERQKTLTAIREALTAEVEEDVVRGNLPRPKKYDMFEFDELQDALKEGIGHVDLSVDYAQTFVNGGFEIEDFEEYPDGERTLMKVIKAFAERGFTLPEKAWNRLSQNSQELLVAIRDTLITQLEIEFFSGNAPLPEEVEVDFEALKSELEAGTREVKLSVGYVQTFVNSGFQIEDFEGFETLRAFVKTIEAFVKGGFTLPEKTWARLDQSDQELLMEIRKALTAEVEVVGGSVALPEKVEVNFETLKKELKDGKRQVELDNATLQEYINNGFVINNPHLEAEDRSLLERVVTFVLGGFTMAEEAWKKLSQGDQELLIAIREALTAEVEVVGGSVALPEKVEVDFDKLAAALKDGTKGVTLNVTYAQTFVNGGFEIEDFDDYGEPEKALMRTIKEFAQGGFTLPQETWEKLPQDDQELLIAIREALYVGLEVDSEDVEDFDAFNAAGKVDKLHKLTEPEEHDEGRDWILIAAIVGEATIGIFTAFAALCAVGIFPQAMLGGVFGCAISITSGIVVLVVGGSIIYLRLRAPEAFASQAMGKHRLNAIKL